MFPAGLPVGIVSSGQEGAFNVQLFINRDRVEYVRIIDYGLRGIIQNVLPAVVVQKGK